MINESEEQINFNKILKCLKCENFLEITWINEKEVLFLCQNKYCSFPMDSEFMNKYIFLKEELTLQIVEKLKNFPFQNQNDLLRNRSFSYESNFLHSDHEYK